VVDVLSHYIDVALRIVAFYLIYRGVTSPKRGPWDARRITAAIISVLIVALAAVVYLLGGPLRTNSHPAPRALATRLSRDGPRRVRMGILARGGRAPDV